MDGNGNAYPNNNSNSDCYYSNINQNFVTSSWNVRGFSPKEDGILEALGKKEFTSAVFKIPKPAVGKHELPTCLF